MCTYAADSSTIAFVNLFCFKFFLWHGMENFCKDVKKIDIF